MTLMVCRLPSTVHANGLVSNETSNIQAAERVAVVQRDRRLHTRLSRDVMPNQEHRDRKRLRVEKFQVSTPWMVKLVMMVLKTGRMGARVTFSVLLSPPIAPLSMTLSPLVSVWAGVVVPKSSPSTAGNCRSPRCPQKCPD